MTKKAERGISLAEQIVDLKSDHKHNLELMKGLNDKIADLEKENAELKKELKKWKDEWQEQVQKAIDEGYARTQQTIQLTKAKEIIEEFCTYRMCDCDGTREDGTYEAFEELRKQAEQFLLKEIKEND